MLKTLSFIARHPLTKDRPLAAFSRFAKWQIRSRLKNEVVVPWIGGAKLVVRSGMTGATGNIYCGLHEFADMAFLLHLLRPGDLFVDVGANIGSYTVLASAVVGADAIAFEPDPETMAALKKNVAINGIEDRVTTVEAAVGREPGKTRFTVGLDTVNHVAHEEDADTREVEVTTLDHVLDGRDPVMIKLDVEGFEADVIAGSARTLQKESLVAVATECDEGDVIRPLMDAGFARVNYQPVARQLSEKFEPGQHNALYLRNSSMVARIVTEAPRREILGKAI
ncbi:MAG: FkbM family methyltransferase [Pseudomonadota bacterium]|nr:FkbM family methyltransferase [Pseudomonadota bacterium]